MKVCSQCKIEKEISYFSKKHDTVDGYQHICKLCKSKYLKNHYAANKAYYKNRALISNKILRVRNLQFTIDYLKTHPCVDCGEKDPLVLEFDHIHDKYKSVSELVSSYCSLDIIQKEIEKCEVRCANCHRRKTAKQFDWYKDIKF